MIVSELARCRGDGFTRVSATIDWEDSARAPFELWFEVDAEDDDALTTEPNAFLVAAVLPAWHGGERRVRIEDETCRMLRDQIVAPLRTLASWYPELGQHPVIESAGSRSRNPVRGQALSLLSCGVDSLATLRANHLWFAHDHPMSIRACALIDYCNVPGIKTVPDARGIRSNPDAGKAGGARAVCDSIGARLLPIRTNLWSLDGDGYFFTNKAFGSYNAAIGHLFSGSFPTCFIAASMDATAPFPVGSHPLLDPYYGSSALRIEHHGTYMDRFERTALISEWDVALEHLNVCQNDVRGGGNCGTCEKCIRTQVALVALGRLHDAPAFERDDVDRALLDTVVEYRMVYSPWIAKYWRDMIEPLRRAGRTDLVDGVEHILSSHESVLVGA